MAVAQARTIDQQLIVFSLDFLNWRLHTQRAISQEIQ
jgi:hypothetical protein